MLESIYRSPLRLLLALSILALGGFFAARALPVSLFPNSQKPSVNVYFRYGNLTAEEFSKNYGRDLESRLMSLSDGEFPIDRLYSDYSKSSVEYMIDFKWGAKPREALQEVRSVVSAQASRYPEEIRQSMGVWTSRKSTGFLAISFFSESRSLQDLYEVLDNILSPGLAQIEDADDIGLWNPTREGIQIELLPEQLANYKILPSDISRAIETNTKTFSSGAFTSGTRTYQVNMPSIVRNADDLGNIPVAARNGKMVRVKDLGVVRVSPSGDRNRIFKTSGAKSLILFASPRAGGNVKAMSENVLKLIRENEEKFPKDVQYRTLVDPSEFIRASIRHVFFEVALGAFLAVAVLFLFVGNLRNTFTAAIEIPLSLILAFILMRFAGMNLNLISLGGLALSAGMNVDASVVVMENIFRYFDKVRGKKISFGEKLSLILKAVNEVKLPVIAATLASLVVFIPLALTSDLTNAILGDLAKAVVFSHGFSAIIALLLVPTVRLHLMKIEDKRQTGVFEKPLRWFEARYLSLLDFFFAKMKMTYLFWGGILLVLGLSLVFLVPRLPKEIVGKPDTDWLVLRVFAAGNTQIRQMEMIESKVDLQVMEKFGDRIRYTFNMIFSPNAARIMIRLKDKSEIWKIWEEMEEEFQNTPYLRYRLSDFNPSELPIPDPPQMRIAIRGGEPSERNEILMSLEKAFDEADIYGRTDSDPQTLYREDVSITPKAALWDRMKETGVRLNPAELADYVRVATTGRYVSEVQFGNQRYRVEMKFPEESVSSIEDIRALPLSIGDAIVPLGALGSIERKERGVVLYKENMTALSVFEGRLKGKKHDPGKKKEAARSHERVVGDWLGSDPTALKYKDEISVGLEDPDVELNGALDQLVVSIGLSILLIFLTSVFQFGQLLSSAVVLVSVPLGMLGVVLSLTIFQSTLSLNSALGIILLNGISVANSILLVDFMIRGKKEGLSLRDAALRAARLRLRPILMTSMTTILGMMPIALGLGEGGKILQPLGIAVSGGLWISTLLTLLIVPVLYVEATRLQANLLERLRGLGLRFRSGINSPREKVAHSE